MMEKSAPRFEKLSIKLGRALDVNHGRMGIQKELLAFTDGEDPWVLDSLLSLDVLLHMMRDAVETVEDAIGARAIHMRDAFPILAKALFVSCSIIGEDPMLPWADDK